MKGQTRFRPHTDEIAPAAPAPFVLDVQRSDDGVNFVITLGLANMAVQIMLPEEGMSKAAEVFAKSIGAKLLHGIVAPEASDG